MPLVCAAFCVSSKANLDLLARIYEKWSIVLCQTEQNQAHYNIHSSGRALFFFLPCVNEKKKKRKKSRAWSSQDQWWGDPGFISFEKKPPPEKKMKTGQRVGGCSCRFVLGKISAFSFLWNCILRLLSVKCTGQGKEFEELHFMCPSQIPVISGYCLKTLSCPCYLNEC